MIKLSDYQRGTEDERERIAKFLETHSIDLEDCALLRYDVEDYDHYYCEHDCTREGEYDEWKNKACARRELANIVRRSDKIYKK